ncbi:smr (Small Related) domain-containing [Chlorella sorokiniana]|uniref:Smr (Small Related) domain-containing n=1 Tax=Chlorella sorokiniana TaxID=3076 RepID=A0A2P6TUF9_CHLSO|nr:smr (Small Related) domain-containing [Chlorella sorokiniana]|eukprot:PRW57700.1 smr (Small Related) domain-containing [Chlorella sorokiniana]
MLQATQDDIEQLRAAIRALRLPPAPSVLRCAACGAADDPPIRKLRRCAACRLSLHQLRQELGKSGGSVEQAAEQLLQASEAQPNKPAPVNKRTAGQEQRLRQQQRSASWGTLAEAGQVKPQLPITPRFQAAGKQPEAPVLAAAEFPTAGGSGAAAAQAQRLRREALAAHAEAAERIETENNQHNSLLELDLHGLHAQEATAAVDRRLQLLHSLLADHATAHSKFIWL